MEKKHFIFFFGVLKYRVSKKLMRPYVTLLNIFSEIAHFIVVGVLQYYQRQTVKQQMPVEKNPVICSINPVTVSRSISRLKAVCVNHHDHSMVVFVVVLLDQKNLTFGTS